ncbi:hypothetical protein AAZX31_12G103200 [Glycine max]
MRHSPSVMAFFFILFINERNQEIVIAQVNDMNNPWKETKPCLQSFVAYLSICLCSTRISPTSSSDLSSLPIFVSIP